MDLNDPVVWGSALTVLLTAGILVFLGFKVKKLMSQGSERR